MIELQEFSKKIEHRDVQFFFSGLGKQFPWILKGVRGSSPKSNYYLISSTWSWGTEAMKMNRVAKVTEHSEAWNSDPFLSRCTTRGLCSACWPEMIPFFPVNSLPVRAFTTKGSHWESVQHSTHINPTPGTTSLCTSHSSQPGSPPWASVRDRIYTPRCSAPSRVGAQLE